MSPFLDQLPFDILFCVISNLSLEDIVHLGQTCPQLGTLLDERTVCRSIIEVSATVKAAVLTIKADNADRSISHTPKKQD
jgi:hypothetical protein